MSKNNLKDHERRLDLITDKSQDEAGIDDTDTTAKKNTGSPFKKQIKIDPKNNVVAAQWAEKFLMDLDALIREGDVKT